MNARRPPVEQPLRILAHSLSLVPVGGVEINTVEDCLALVGQGHTISLMYGADGELRVDYDAAGATLAGPFSFDFSFAPRQALRELWGFVAAARWARRQRADVLWLNRIEHLVWGQVISRWAGIPLVCHLHGPPVYHRMRLLGAGVAHFVAVSEFVRQAYIARGIAPDRISLLHNAITTRRYPFGADAERSAARRALGLPADVPIVLCYGQMSAGKGVPTLLRAWRELGPRADGAILVLVDATSATSDAARDEEVARELRHLDPASYRIFPVTNNVVPFLHASDLVVFPTLLPEAFGRVIIEGMATGRPVIASRVGAVPEILNGPMSRFLVEAGDAPELASRIDEFLHWREGDPGLGAECSQWVAERFPYSAHIDGLQAILQGHRRRRRRRGRMPQLERMDDRLKSVVGNPSPATSTTS